MQRKISSILLIALLFIIPNLSHASDHIDSAASKIPGIDGVGIYQVTFSVGGFDTETHFPRLATRAVSHVGDRPDTVHYYFENDAGDVADAGVSVGILQSKSAPIENGAYIVEAGETHEFTFTALLSISPDEGDAFRMQMSSLPFLTHSGKTPFAFNPAELSRHDTKFLYLHSQPDDVVISSKFILIRSKD